MGSPGVDLLSFGVAWLDLVAHELLGSVGHVDGLLCWSINPRTTAWVDGWILSPNFRMLSLQDKLTFWKKSLFWLKSPSILALVCVHPGCPVFTCPRLEPQMRHCGEMRTTQSSVDVLAEFVFLVQINITKSRSLWGQDDNGLEHLHLCRPIQDLVCEGWYSCVLFAALKLSVW